MLYTNKSTSMNNGFITSLSGAVEVRSFVTASNKTYVYAVEREVDSYLGGKLRFCASNDAWGDVKTAVGVLRDVKACGLGATIPDGCICFYNPDGRTYEIYPDDYTVERVMRMFPDWMVVSC